MCLGLFFNFILNQCDFFGQISWEILLTLLFFKARSFIRLRHHLNAINNLVFLANILRVFITWFCNLFQIFINLYRFLWKLLSFCLLYLWHIHFVRVCCASKSRFPNFISQCLIWFSDRIYRQNVYVVHTWISSSSQRVSLYLNKRGRFWSLRLWNDIFMAFLGRIRIVLYFFICEVKRARLNFLATYLNEILHSGLVGVCKILS